MSVNASITIPFAKQEKERLNRLALRYGLSLPEFSRIVLRELTSEIPEEPFESYANSSELRASFSRALRDLRYGRVHDRL